MNIFSLLNDPDDPINLTEKKYNNETKRSEPYVQTWNNVIRCFALCPECHNPVILVNRGVNTTESKTLYARHAGYDVPGLAIHVQEEYEDCQLANPHRFDSKMRRKPGVKTSRIKDIFLKHIDIIISNIERETGTKLSDSVINSMITDFCNNKGYEYRAVSVHNLPLAFMFMTEAKNLLGCSVNNEIANAINNSSRNFEAPNPMGYNSVFIRKRQHSKFANLNLYFSEHSIPKSEEDSYEAVTMYITEIEGSEHPENAPVLFKKKIRLNTSRFANTILRRERLHKMVLSHFK